MYLNANIIRAFFRALFSLLYVLEVTTYPECSFAKAAVLTHLCAINEVGLSCFYASKEVGPSKQEYLRPAERMSYH